MTTPPLHAPLAGLTDYLGVLTERGAGQGWLDVRYRTRGGMRTLFYPARGRRRSLEQLLAHISQHSDVYCGCALRRVQRGDRAAIGDVWTLWAECDDPAATTALTGFEPKPTLVIASGTPGNVHAYWALTSPVSASLAEDANRRLAQALGADPVCYDASRLLRPPGTLNHKHTPPRLVELLAARPRAYALGDVVGGIPAPPVSRHPAHGSPRAVAGDPLLAIAPATYVPALTGQPLGRDRKVACPLHDDHTPSLHAYATAEQGWFCFGCRRGGSLYDLAAAVWQLDTRGTDFLKLKERLRRLFA